MRCCQRFSIHRQRFFPPLTTPKRFIPAACQCFSAKKKEKERSPVCIRLWVKWQAGLSHLWRSKVNKNILELLRPRGGKDLLLEKWGEWWNFHFFCPTHILSIYGSTDVLGAVEMVHQSVLWGYYFGEGGEGGWLAYFTSLSSYEIRLCLPFPYFSPYHESADRLFALVYIVGYLQCAIVQEEENSFIIMNYFYKMTITYA